MHPIPDMARIGSSDLFVYWMRKDFVAQVKALIDRPQTFHLNFEHHSWKEKARQFGAQFERFV